MDIKAQIAKSIKDNNPVIGVAVGSGLSAKQVAEGGADFILALSAGKFRNAGVSSMGCMLPFANSNDMNLEFAQKEILPRVKNTPVVFGAFAADITKADDVLLTKIEEAGFDGVNNFPTVALIDGNYRKALEANGLGFQREVEFMRKAVTRGLYTIAFVFNKEQAKAMAEAEVDMVCAHLGWTAGGEKGIKNREDISENIKLVKEIFSTVEKINPDILHMIYGGGDIKDPLKANEFYKETDTLGYIGGSTFERIPVESSIKDTVSSFKNFYKLHKENIKLKEELNKKKSFDNLVGHSLIMQQMYELIDKVANKNVNVLVSGESGTGKELVTRAIHYSSQRAKKAFVKINCATIPEKLLESELFGHEKGSFTGAAKQRIGKFELADKGTLFLDEVGEIDINLQAKLLRVLQENEFERVGSNKTIKVDVRVISATNKDLRQAVAEGKFREDLFYRLNVVSINTPPLRKHKEDIPLLVNSFIKQIKEKFDIKILKIEPAVFDVLMEYDWPGNVRELKNTIERAAILSEDEIIKLENLPQYFKKFTDQHDYYNSVQQNEDLAAHLATFEKQIILNALEEQNWNQTETAENLGISRKTLYNKIKKYDLNN
ncbi:phosphoenolpyruvate hydrolase family protein [Halanaerobium sp. Z-7514]|uniref:Phosphoenolpyruvate hydrolase family protein n=1 Tax=Halanaerobium polyolivorans TaxID=2886943 RepID=A0AAW4X1J0_9FIRM|nr:phosphoenolpyruvate hydrolase family protein [Halanaerobium polyolivorans]MCC3145680.1 phosphoenolpyruvate hydrolase family protein [Halanaerobium polyolivorans]RQD72898.1 MAG: AAA family ATPase [Halanaerobium sp. MSAO_Bac5]